VERRNVPAPQNHPTDPISTPRPTLGTGHADNPYQPSFGQPAPPTSPVPASPQGKRVDWPAVEGQGSCEICPECASHLSHESACVICHACGYSQCG
jgi:hypothetical protein